MKNLLLLGTLIFVFNGCGRTVFYGESTVKDGVIGCEKKCLEWGMELVGMVAMGEYSDGCICQKKGESISLNDVGRTLIISASGVSPATPAVIDQMQRDEEERNATYFEN